MTGHGIALLPLVQGNRSGRGRGFVDNKLGAPLSKLHGYFEGKRTLTI